MIHATVLLVATKIEQPELLVPFAIPTPCVGAKPTFPV